MTSGQIPALGEARGWAGAGYVERHVPVQGTALVQVSVEHPAVDHVPSLVLQHSPELGLDAGVAESDGAVQIVRVGVRFYLVISRSFTTTGYYPLKLLCKL